MGIRAKTQDQLDPKVLARHREQEGEEALIIAEQPPGSTMRPRPVLRGLHQSHPQSSEGKGVLDTGWPARGLMHFGEAEGRALPPPMPPHGDTGDSHGHRASEGRAGTEQAQLM